MILAIKIQCGASRELFFTKKKADSSTKSEQNKTDVHQFDQTKLCKKRFSTIVSQCNGFADFSNEVIQKNSWHTAVNHASWTQTKCRTIVFLDLVFILFNLLHGLMSMDGCSLFLGGKFGQKKKILHCAWTATCCFGWSKNCIQKFCYNYSFAQLFFLNYLFHANWFTKICPKI